MPTTPNVPDSHTPTCSHCGSDLVVTRGAGRVALLNGFTVAVPAAMELTRCHACGRSYPTPEQAAELRAAADRDWLGDGGLHDAPVLRGT